MKTSRILAVVLVCAMFLLSAGAAKNMSDDIAARNGGWVKVQGKGSVAVIDCRADGTASDYQAGIEVVEKTFSLPFKTKKGRPFSLVTARDQVKDSGGNVAVFVIDDPTYPLALSACEERWSLLNVAKAKEGCSTVEQLKRRLSVLFVRQCCRVLGDDESKGEDCCFFTVLSPSDLDKVTSLDVTYYPSVAINETMSFRGLESFDEGTYREACEMGVAPHPTNDLQKAIWKQVHTPPTKPLKITYDKDKKKPIVK